ncbi:hypothetical protein Ct61P_01738 [Colletotrichum tofieldiae]|nr:hypothetical protein Ct61P_01738 [Colletotrichum tofieldiae]
MVPSSSAPIPGEDGPGLASLELSAAQQTMVMEAWELAKKYEQEFRTAHEVGDKDTCGTSVIGPSHWDTLASLQRRFDQEKENLACRWAPKQRKPQTKDRGNHTHRTMTATAIEQTPSVIRLSSDSAISHGTVKGKQSGNNSAEGNDEPDSDDIYASPTILKRKRVESNGSPRTVRKQARPSIDATAAIAPDVSTLQEPSNLSPVNAS